MELFVHDRETSASECSPRCCFKYRRVAAAGSRRTDLTSPTETPRYSTCSRTSRSVTSSMKTALAGVTRRGAAAHTAPRTGAVARIARTRDRDTCCMRATLKAKAEHRQTTHAFSLYLSALFRRAKSNPRRSEIPVNSVRRRVPS